jgi:integrase
LSVRSVQYAHRVLHRALADGVRWNLIPINPATGARAPRVQRSELMVWTSDEAATFLRHVANDRLSALWILALHTGMRRGELAGLRWKDVDLDDGTLTVAQQRTNADHEVVISAPKGRSQRQIVLAPATVAALRQHRAVKTHASPSASSRRRRARKTSRRSSYDCRTKGSASTNEACSERSRGLLPPKAARRLGVATRVIIRAMNDGKLRRVRLDGGTLAIPRRRPGRSSALFQMVSEGFSDDF